MRSAVSRCSTSAASPSSTAAYPARSWTPCAIFVPQAREHELQKWRLDAVFVALARGEAASRNAELDPPYSHLVEHLVHQLRLDRDPIVWRNEGVVPLDRTEDGRLSGRSVEALEAQPIRKQIRNRSFQRVESGERVLAHSDQDIHAESGPLHHVRKLCSESSATGVIEEALLELIEDQVEIAARTSCGLCESVHW